MCNLLLRGFSPSSVADIWRWEMNYDNVFSVRSLRQIIESNRAPMDPKPIHWSRTVPLKVRRYIWKSRMNKIPCLKELATCEVAVVLMECSMCINDIKSTDHMFLLCPFAVKVWYKICEWCGWIGDKGEQIRNFPD